MLGTAVAKHYRLGGFNSRRLFSHNSGGWKSPIKVLAGLGSPEASLLVLQMTVFSLCPHMSSLCICLCPNLFL